MHAATAAETPHAPHRVPSRALQLGDTFVISPSVRVTDLAERAALFSERQGQLFELNETAALLWCVLRDGGSGAEAASRLRALGAEQDEAENYVLCSVRAWCEAGYLVPRAATRLLARTPTWSAMLDIDGLGVALRVYGDADANAVQDVFGHFKNASAPPGLDIAAAGIGEDIFFFADNVPAGMTAHDRAIPFLKALLTDAYCETPREGFLIHGGLIASAGKRLLISGDPGAGKSTLVLALCGAGCAYGGDDIVRIDGAGRATGVPFAASVKTGAWPLLAHAYPGLASQPVYERSDGQRTRYLLPQRLDIDGARGLDHIVLLARTPGADAALEPVAPLDALCVLLASAYSERRGMSAGLFEAVAQNIAASACWRLVYDDLSSAAELVKRTLT